MIGERVSEVSSSHASRSAVDQLAAGSADSSCRERALALQNVLAADLAYALIAGVPDEPLRVVLADERLGLGVAFSRCVDPAVPEAAGDLTAAVALTDLRLDAPGYRGENPIGEPVHGSRNCRRAPRPGSGPGRGGRGRPDLVGAGRLVLRRHRHSPGVAAAQRGGQGLQAGPRHATRRYPDPGEGVGGERLRCRARGAGLRFR